jgi:hypothetical protein
MIAHLLVFSGDFCTLWGALDVPKMPRTSNRNKARQNNLQKARESRKATVEEVPDEETPIPRIRLLKNLLWRCHALYNTTTPCQNGTTRRNNATTLIRGMPGLVKGTVELLETMTASGTLILGTTCLI